MQYIRGMDDDIRLEANERSGRGGGRVNNRNMNNNMRRNNEYRYSNGDHPTSNAKGRNEKKATMNSSSVNSSGPRGGGGVNIASNNNVGNNSKSNGSNRSRRKGNRMDGSQSSTSNRNRSGKKGNRGGSSQSLHLPHSKLTIRRIDDLEKYGSVEKTIGLVRELFSSASVSVRKSEDNPNYSVKLDEASLMREYVEEEKDEEEEKKEQHSVTKQDDEVVSKEGMESIQYNNWIHVLLTAKTLYLIPPRKSRRRGLLTGAIYMVLYPTIVHHTYKKWSNYERCRAVAATKIALQSFSNLLSTTSSFVIETSPSQKVFLIQDGNNPARNIVEGSIFETEDFSNFLQCQINFEQELKNRPKPQPGGGFLDTLDTRESEETSNNMSSAPSKSTSALVQYLKKKHADAAAAKASSYRSRMSSKKSSSNKSVSLAINKKKKKDRKKLKKNSTSTTKILTKETNTTPVIATVSKSIVKVS